MIPNRVKGLPVILLFIFSLFVFFKKKRIKYPIKKVLWFSSIYIILLMSLTYTDNFVNIDKALSTRLGLLVIPISFGFLSGFKKKLSIKFLFKFQTLLLVITTIFSICILAYLSKLGVFLGGMSLYDAISYVTNEMKPINQHPIYGSIFISLSIIITVYTWFIKKNKTLILFTILPLLIQIFTLLILGRKGVLLALILSLFFMFLFFMRKEVTLILKLTISVSMIILTILIVSSKRFTELYNKENYSLNIKQNSTSLRYNIYLCVFEKIEESPLIGFGLGDVQVELNKSFKEKSPLLTKSDYNSHNQYLSYFLSSGIFGFLLLITFMGSIFVNAFIKRNIILLTLVVFFSISMLFENILERQSGVILFSFYLCLFSFFNFHKKELSLYVYEK
jgi:O-antigen ligase